MNVSDRGKGMPIVLCCATRRGYRVLRRLTELVPQSQLVVFSFREELWEPPFLDDIRDLTLAAGGKFFEAARLGEDRWLPFWESTRVDLMLAVNWRYMIPSSVCRRTRLGTFVFHDSLLPEYRGFSPTVWAILNGEDHTGVTLFEAAEEMDSGDVVDQERVPIGPDETIDIVFERVTRTYVEVLERNLEKLLHDAAPRRPQDHARATYGCKRLPEDNEIDWTAPSHKVYNLIRAVSAPYPGAYTHFRGRRLHVWAAGRVAGPRRCVGSVPGRVAEVRPGEGSIVSTGEGAVLLTRVQLEGEATVCAANLLQSVGDTLGR